MSDQTEQPQTLEPPHPMQEWAIVQYHGLTLIGKAVDSMKPVRAADGRIVGQAPVGRALSPVYELRPMFQGGNIGHMCVPVWLLSVEIVEIPSDAIVCPVMALPPLERDAMAKVVAKGQEIWDKMKKAQEMGAGSRQVPMRPRIILSGGPLSNGRK